jgi:hypothetical protein
MMHGKTRASEKTYRAELKGTDQKQCYNGALVELAHNKRCNVGKVRQEHDAEVYRP